MEMSFAVLSWEREKNFNFFSAIGSSSSNGTYFSSELRTRPFSDTKRALFLEVIPLDEDDFL